MKSNSATAALVIIGNEVLSGRTKDKNLNYLAEKLSNLGVRLLEVRVIPDIEKEIVDCINHLRKKYTYIFTTGGIGPTHDDITSESVAKAFEVGIERNKEAEQILERFYPKGELTEPRLKMADIPVGARLIYNPISAAPGYVIDNVYVMAGVPSIMQAMFEGVAHELVGGIKLFSKEVAAYISESKVAEEISKLQDNYSDVEIGSYPFIKNERLGVAIVFRSEDKKSVDLVASVYLSFLKSKNVEMDD